MFDTMESAPLPLNSGDSALHMRLAVAALAAEDRDTWTGTARSERLVELLEIRERLHAEILRLAASWDRDRAWEIDGSLSPRSWLKHRTPVSDREAKQLVKAARLVDKHQEIAGALADGDIATPHVEAIGNVMSKNRAPLLKEHAAVLVEQAAKLPPTDFMTVMRRWASLADDHLAQDTFAEKWNRRHLHLSTDSEGWMTGTLLLDPASGAALVGALDHVAPPDAEDAADGQRTLSQRRADGLADIVNHHTNGGTPGGNPPSVIGVIDVASLLGETPQMAAARCDVDGIGPVARTVLDQMCCDARITRFIMAGRSQVLDMGRSARVATTAQRKALAVRDQHCRFPSCSRRPQWCDAHHIAGWVESLGETNIDNLILLCRRHHTLVHNSRWTITRTADGDFEFNHPARGP